MPSEEQKFKEIFDISKRFSCEDTPEVKDLILKINAGVSDEARRIHRDAIIIDTCTFSLEKYSWNLKEAGSTAINCTVMGNKDGPAYAMRNLIDYTSAVKNDKHLMLVNQADDILVAKREGKVGVIIGAQSCDFISHNDLEAAVRVFQRGGLRVMTIGYNHRSFAGDGCYTGTDAGLTNEGRVLVRAMQKCGVTLDLSHVGRRSTLDAMEICETPPVFTHSNPCGLYDHPRNITDEQAKMCAQLGGVVGVCAYNVMLWNGNDFPTIEHFVNCIDYFVDLLGVDHVGIGLDSNATIGGYEHRKMIFFYRLLKNMQGTNSIAYKSYEAGRGVLGECVEGLMNMANIPNIVEHLLRRGYKEQDIRKILGENWLRVFRETWR